MRRGYVCALGIAGALLAEALRRARRRAEQRMVEVEAAVQARDQTVQALRESEARFRAVFTSAAVGLSRVDPDGRILEINPALQEMLGYRPAELAGKRFAEISHPDDGRESRERYRELVAGRRDKYSMEKRYFRQDGSVLWGNVTVSAVRSADGRLQFGIGIIQDVTERRRLEQMQHEFLLMAAHELRNPLAAVSGFAQLIQRNAGVNSERAAARIVAQSARLERLINDLVDVSRLETGRLELKPGRTDLAELARASADQAQAASTAHTVRVEAPGRPLEGWWDRDRICQVLENLLSNAIKYAPGGDVLVRVEDLGEAARASVRDDGPGIPPEALPRLFERFYRVHRPGTSGVDGLGLGLYVTKSIVEAHGGRVEVESVYGSGSTFAFSLPYRPPPSEPESTRAE